MDSSPNIEQLLRHSDSFSGEDQKILLLLTREPINSNGDEIKHQVSARHPEVIFQSITFEDVCKVASSLFKDYEYEMSALVNDFVEYCNDAALFDQSRQLLRIVPCGLSLGINKKYGIYFHPSDRGYTKHRFVGIYKDKAVQTIWEIDSVFDVEYSHGKLRKTFIEGRDTHEYDQKLVEMINDAKRECGFDVESGHRFFCGKPIETNYVKSSSGGIQGARFVNLRYVIGEFNNAFEVAQKLRSTEWE